MPKSSDTPARSKRAGSQLTPDAIIEASLRIAARGSEDAFTVRRLGGELGADPTAIYRHFRDKDELLLSVADRMLREVLDSIPEGLDWKDRLRALAEGSLEVALRYPVVGSTMASRTTRRPNEFRVVELILGAVTEAGLEGAEAAVHYRMVGDSLLAYVGQRAAYLLFDADVRAADESSWHREYRLVDPTGFPHITRLGAQLAEVTEEQIFEARVEALINAIETRVEVLRGGKAL
ncbi:TetR/AcrR family transcriptional regulator [Streptomyces sp. NBC_00335]|uniref:TetR/AcrR family transcriptional regulator n=1 Tax=unclassified Streptomyces TaxID=2593676 RepID=UPI00224F3921|nr:MULTISPECIES: TetR/AcrR family transcriptional regulator [unclassified Streptomyces]MCX5409360.1 TetR/AcrR family transcriptional regulator [Streptomyces sp. NBC_00086]